jgi:hypothetical protein
MFAAVLLTGAIMLTMKMHDIVATLEDLRYRVRVAEDTVYVACHDSFKIAATLMLTHPMKMFASHDYGTQNSFITPDGRVYWFDKVNNETRITDPMREWPSIAEGMFTKLES